MRAAANYRNPDAQFEMGKMFLTGRGRRQGKRAPGGRWFQLAAEKGHAGAQATLGNLLFQSGTDRARAGDDDCGARAGQSDRPRRGSARMQEEAFSLAGEADRRTAIALAEDILSKGNGDTPDGAAAGAARPDGGGGTPGAQRASGGRRASGGGAPK